MLSTNGSRLCQVSSEMQMSTSCFLLEAWGIFFLVSAHILCPEDDAQRSNELYEVRWLVLQRFTLHLPPNWSQVIVEQLQKSPFPNLLVKLVYKNRNYWKHPLALSFIRSTLTIYGTDRSCRCSGLKSLVKFTKRDMPYFVLRHWCYQTFYTYKTSRRPFAF